MTDIRLDKDRLGAVLSTTGGCIWRFFLRRDGGEEAALLREPPAGEARAPLQAGCFPLVPFGNRIAGNAFAFEGRSYALTPNMPWDPHVLHGDGWTSEWTIEAAAADRAELAMSHRADGSPFAYDARQSFALDGDTLSVRLAVTNRGAAALPFGLGWHPYFPLTPDTRLEAPAGDHWEEGPGWLPTVRGRPPADLDFRAPAPLPRRWVNNGFEDWTGTARIRWPDRGLALVLEADPLFRRYFLSCPIRPSTPAMPMTSSAWSR